MINKNYVAATGIKAAGEAIFSNQLIHL